MIRRAPPPRGRAAHGRADRAALTRINSGLCQDDGADAPEFFHASPSRNDAEILKHGLRPAAGSMTFGTTPRWKTPRVYFALGFTNGIRWQDFVEEQLDEPATLWKVNLTARQQAALRIDDIAQYEGDSCAFFGTTPIPAEQLQLEQASQGEGTNWFREPQGRGNRGRAARRPSCFIDLTVDLWHGTTAEGWDALVNRGEAFRGADPKRRAFLAPLGGRVYGSTLEDYALAYARRAGLPPGGVVRIRGSDPRPDEDWIGQLIHGFAISRLDAHVGRWYAVEPAWQAWASTAWALLPTSLQAAVLRDDPRRGFARLVGLGKRVIRALESTPAGCAHLRQAVELALRPTNYGRRVGRPARQEEASALSVRADTVRLLDVHPSNEFRPFVRVGQANRLDRDRVHAAVLEAVKSVEADVREYEPKMVREMGLPAACNNGWCADIADFVEQRIPGAEVFTADSLKDPVRWGLPADVAELDIQHDWVHWRGLHFDAEAPWGVEHAADLPIFRRQLTYPALEARLRARKGRANRAPSRIQRLKRAAAWLKQNDPEHFEGGCADISYQLWWITSKMLKWPDVKILAGSARMYVRSEAVAHVWLEVDGERFDPTWGRGAWYKGSALTTRRQQIGTLEGLFGVMDVGDARMCDVQPAELLEILR